MKPLFILHDVQFEQSSAEKVWQRMSHRGFHNALKQVIMRYALSMFEGFLSETS